MSDPEAPFSFGRLAAKALGAAGLVLLVAAPIAMIVARWSVTAALAVAIGAIVAMVAVIALVTRRELRPIQAQIDEAKAARAAREETSE